MERYDLNEIKEIKLFSELTSSAPHSKEYEIDLKLFVFFPPFQ